MFFSDLGVPPNLISGAEREGEREREVEEEIEQNAEEGEGAQDKKMKGERMKKGKDAT